MTDNGTNSDIDALPLEQRKALEVLASGGTKAAAAMAANRSQRTLYRWLGGDPDFQTALRTVTNEAIHDAGRRFIGLLEKSLTAVSDELDAGTMDTRLKLRTLDIVARHVVNLRQLGELEERVRALEERANGQP